MIAGQAHVDPLGAHLAYADHLGSRIPRLMPLLRPSIRPQGPLHHLGQCSDGALDFALTAVAPDPGTSGTEPPPIRPPADLAAVDQELSITAARLDQRLAPVKSGHLIRLVAQAASGAFVGNLVLPGRYLVGAVLTGQDGRPDTEDRPDIDGQPDTDGQPDIDALDLRPDWTGPGFAEVDRADRELATLTDAIRSRLNQPTLNAGAYRDDTGPGDARPPDKPWLVGDDGHPLLAMHTRTLALDGLHYLAYHEQGTLAFSVDLLGDPGLDDYAELSHPSARRRFYRHLGAEFEPLAAELSRVLLPVIEDQLCRIVLDVELGAIYYFRISPDAYLLGVTLNQRRVEAADRALRSLASELVARSSR